MNTTERNVWVLAYPAEDVPGQWVGHCLDLDIISVGTSLEHALQMTSEAVGLCVQWDAAKGLDPFARNKAPQEEWDRLDRVVSEGKYDPTPGGTPAAVVTQFHVAYHLWQLTAPGEQPIVERLPPAWAA